MDVVTTGFTGAENANIKFGDTVVVMGIGPIGLMAVAGAAHLGAARILAVGSRPVCVECAYDFGASEVLSYKNGDLVQQVMERTDGLGADSVIICGGNDETFAQAIDMVRYGIGTVSNVNYFGGNRQSAISKILRWPRHGWQNHPYGAGRRRQSADREDAFHGKIWPDTSRASGHSSPDRT